MHTYISIYLFIYNYGNSCNPDTLKMSKKTSQIQGFILSRNPISKQTNKQNKNK